VGGVITTTQEGNRFDLQPSGTQSPRTRTAQKKKPRGVETKTSPNLRLVLSKTLPRRLGKAARPLRAPRHEKMDTRAARKRVHRAAREEKRDGAYHPATEE
jgi:hypothetical protein